MIASSQPHSLSIFRGLYKVAFAPLRKSFGAMPRRTFALFFAFLLLGILPSLAEAAILKPANSLGLVAYWSMEDGRGSTVTDFSGKGNTGTLTGNASWKNSKFGTGLSFDGTGDYVVAAPAVTGFPLTMCAWFKLNEAVQDAIVNLGANDGTNYIDLRVSNTALSVFVKDGTGTANQNLSGDIGTGKWNHACGTFSSTTITPYLNGVAGSPQSHSKSPTGIIETKIGRLSGFTTLDLNGEVDDVRIYNRALSPTEISALYSNASIGKIKNSARGLVAQYAFDEMRGASVYDKTGNGNTGSLLPVPTSITRAQFKHTYPGTTGASLAFDSSVTSGNLIIVTMSGTAGSVSTVGDNCGNTYAEAASGAVGVTASAVWYAYNVTGGGCTVTVTSTMNDFGMTIFEYAGASTGDPLGETNVDLQKKAGTPFSVAGDGMVFVHWANEAGGNDATGYGSGWSGIQHDTSHYDLQEENLTATAGTYTASVGGADQGSDVLIAVAFRGLNRPVWAAGKFGGALKFDGLDDYVNLGVTPSEFMPTRSVAVSAWVKRTGALADYSGVLSVGSGNNNGYILIGQSDNKIGFWLDTTGSGSWQNAISDSALTLDAWTFVTGTWDGTTVRLYINGTLQSDTGTASAIVYDTSKSVQIGRYGVAATKYWPGGIDDVRIYNRALSAQEITNLYNSSGEAVAIVNASMNNQLRSGLVGLWSFDGPDMTSSTSTDRSGNGNDGTLVGGPTKTIGRIGQAIRFTNGVAHYISAGSASSLDDIEDQGGGGMTISAWVKSSNFSQSSVQQIVGKDNLPDTTNGAWLLYIDSNAAVNFSKSYDVTTLLRKTSNNAVATNSWQNIITTWDGSASASSVHIYINGTETSYLTTQNGAGPKYSDATMSLKIGGPGSSGRTFPGSIDDLRIYNRILSASEIQQLYTMGK